MTIEARIAAHTEGASDALAASIVAPSNGSRHDVDPASVAADVDRAIGATYSKGGGVARWGSPHDA